MSAKPGSKPRAQVWSEFRSSLCESLDINGGFENELKTLHMDLGQGEGDWEAYRETLISDRFIASFVREAPKFPQLGEYRCIGNDRQGRKVFAPVTFSLDFTENIRRSYDCICPIYDVDFYMSCLGLYWDGFVENHKSYSEFDTLLVMAEVRNLYSIIHPFLDANTRCKNGWSIKQFRKMGLNYDVPLDPMRAYNIPFVHKVTRYERNSVYNLLASLKLPVVHDGFFYAIEIKDGQYFFNPFKSTTQEYFRKFGSSFRAYLLDLKRNGLNRERADLLFGDLARAMEAEWRTK